MNLIIRADATSAMGTGHVMRCIALAQYWRGEVHFVSHCKVQSIADILRSQGFKLDYVSEPLAGWDILTKLAGQSSANAIVFDGYHFTAADYRRAKTLGPVVVSIDDNAHLSEYPVDILVNQNAYAASLPYVTAQQTVRLLGSKYALIRKEFLGQESRRQSGDGPITVLVTMGGSDPMSVTPTIIQALKQLQNIRAIAVAGMANPHVECLRHLIDDNPAFSLRTLVRDMSSLMSEVDLVVTAAGSTCWECCCMALPILTVVVAENQRGIAESLAVAGASINLGWHEHLTVNSVVDGLKMLVPDGEARRRMAANAKRFVDGRGALRVVENISAFVAKN